eukprot:g8551.t1
MQTRTQSIFSDEGLAVDHDSNTKDHQVWIGEFLKSEREQKKNTLKQVAEATFLDEEDLKNLEEGRFDLLPQEGVYLFGIVRSYARFLKLDQDENVLKFKAQVFQSKPEENDITFPISKLNTSRSRSMTIAIAVFLGLLTILGIVFLEKQQEKLQIFEDNISDAFPHREMHKSTPTISLSQRSIAEKSLIAKQRSMHHTSEPQSKKPLSLSKSIVGVTALEAVEESWIKIHDAEGNSVFQGLLKKGEIQNLHQDKETYSLSTGNLGGLRFHTQDERVLNFGGSGEVCREIVLKPAL